MLSRVSASGAGLQPSGSAHAGPRVGQRVPEQRERAGRLDRSSGKHRWSVLTVESLATALPAAVREAVDRERAQPRVPDAQRLQGVLQLGLARADAQRPVVDALRVVTVRAGACDSTAGQDGQRRDHDERAHQSLWPSAWAAARLTVTSLLCIAVISACSALPSRISESASTAAPRTSAS